MSNISKATLFFLLMGWVLVSARYAQADIYHYNNLLIGNRATGLAGAYVAISDDPSGLYYNPAGIVYSLASNISANMNAYNISRTKYNNALGGKPWIRTSTALVPNFFGITQPLGPGTVGVSYAVTDSLLEDQDQTFNDIPSAGSQFTINYNNQDSTSQIGPSYALPISNKFSIGLTLYGVIRQQQQIFNQSFEFPDQEIIVDEATQETKSVDFFHIENLYVTRTEYGVNPVLGFMYSPVDNLSLGLTLSKIFLLTTNYNDQYTVASNFCKDDAGEKYRCEDPYYLRATTNYGKNRPTPWQVNIGATWFASSRFLLTSSLWAYEAINDTSRPLLNAAGGLEYYLTGKWAIRLGGYTDMANTPRLKANAVNIYNEHVDIFGATFSISHFTRTSAISFGGVGRYGRGQAQIIGGNLNLQDVEFVGLSVFISATNSF